MSGGCVLGMGGGFERWVRWGDVGFWFLDVGILGGRFRAVGAFYEWGEVLMVAWGDVGFWFLDVGILGGRFRAVGAFYGWGEVLGLLGAMLGFGFWMLGL